MRHSRHGQPHELLGFRVSGLGFRVFGFRVSGLGFRVYGYPAGLHGRLPAQTAFASLGPVLPKEETLVVHDDPMILGTWSGGSCGV